MSRQFLVDIHAANLSATPHPVGIYEKLIKDIFRKRQPIQIWGERYAIMTEMHVNKNLRANEPDAAYGVISTFTDIDVDAPWLNRSTGKAADEQETSSIVIPKALRPHFAQFYFYFDFASHVLAFQANARMPKRAGGFKQYSLRQLHMENYLNSAIAMPGVTPNATVINVTIIPDPSKLKEILSSKNIREITMVVTVPNNDSVANDRGRFRARMAEIKAKKKTESYVAADEEGLKPDKELIRTAEISALDGRVTARVATNDGVIPLSTSDMPIALRVAVDTNIEPESATIQRGAKRLISEINND